MALQKSTSASHPPIEAGEAGTLWELFRLRVERSPQDPAYRECDPATGRWDTHTWKTIAERVDQYRAALAREKLTPGECVAILLANGIDWVCADLAAHAAGLVVVGLYPQESATTNAYILGHSDARLLLVDTPRRWEELTDRRAEFPLLRRVWVHDGTGGPCADMAAQRLVDVLVPDAPPPDVHGAKPDDLATLIYTSGTTGKPKGVMLTHAALLWNAAAVTRIVPPRADDVFLSILPLAHAFERTIGYYLPMMGGSTVAFARSTQTLRDDLGVVRPTALLAVPRLFERISEGIAASVAGNPIKRGLLALTAAVGWRRFEAVQSGRSAGWLVRLLWPILKRVVADPVLAAFGGRLRIAVSGGSPLDPAVARRIIGLGVPVVEGYGLTETAPVVAANNLEDNVPGTVGPPLAGIEVKIGVDGELLVRSPAMFRGYWKDEAATARALDRDGWLATGDIAEIRDGRIFVRGRLKEMVVLSIGEKINPTEMEAEILHDPLIAQVVVLGSGRPHLVALAVLNAAVWSAFATENGFDPARPNGVASSERLLARVVARLGAFPRFAEVRAMYLTLEPWTIDAGLLTPTLKVKRDRLQALFAKEIDALYASVRARAGSKPQ
jgi:long-chain acyl-CoA synthetase